MARLSARPLNPSTDGIVDAFEIERVDRADKGRRQVTVGTRVRRFDGQVSSRRLVFTVAHQDGRWFIEDWRPGAP